MKKQVENSFRGKCRFEVSFRYELFYSLNILLDPQSRIHPTWRRSNLRVLGGEFNKLMNEIGHSWEIWPVLAATLPGPLSNPKFEEILDGIHALPILRFQEKVIQGLLHSEDATRSLIKGQVSLKEAVSKIPKRKREWISHIGFFPYDLKSPQVIALEKLLSDPNQFREIISRILEIYWKKSFSKTWECLVPQLRRSLQERERLFYSCSFAEFARQALLRIAVDEEKGAISAIRGGYRIRFKDIEECYFLASAFNDRRFWSAFRDDGKNTTVYFPYFDPSIALDLQVAKQVAKVTDPLLDPALIFKALGDSTRFAIATLLARSPTSSVELAKILAVSKPTISHHVHLLREAGLIHETYVNGSVELELKRSVLENLSTLTISKLFDSGAPISLTRTRGGLLS